MDANRSHKFINFLLTFAIGLLAGIAPFFLVCFLPAVLNPRLNIEEPNYLAVLVVGGLVGVITSIMFAKIYDTKGPQDIFVYALGIPALLIGTISNLSTQLESRLKLNAANDAVISGEPAIKDVTDLQNLGSLKPSASAERSLAVHSVWAAESAVSKSKSTSVQTGSYFVFIGSYDKEAEAFEALTSLRQTKLGTERYIPKNLTVMKSGNRFYLDYAGPLSKDEAQKVYKLLRINDPEWSPQLVRLVGSSNSVSKNTD